jgi:hypothetical protein
MTIHAAKADASRARNAAGSHIKMQALGLVWSDLDPQAADLVRLRTVLDEPTQYGARLLHTHWLRKEAEGGFVVGREVPSRSLACVLRNLAIYEPIEGGADYRVRLAGTAFTRRFGRDVTGRLLSDVYTPQKFAHHRADLSAVVDSHEPKICDVRLARGDRLCLHFESLRLPVLSRDGRETWVLSGIFYFDWT